MRRSLHLEVQSKPTPLTDSQNNCHGQALSVNFGGDEPLYTCIDGFASFNIIVKGQHFGNISRLLNDENPYPNPRTLHFYLLGKKIVFKTLETYALYPD